MDRDPNQRLVEGLRSRFLAGTEQTALAYTYHTSDFRGNGKRYSSVGRQWVDPGEQGDWNSRGRGKRTSYIREFEAKNAWAASGRFPPHYRNG